MFERILLPLDVSDRHGAAVAMATKLCSRPEGEITLLHVIELIPSLSVEEERPFYDRLRRTAQEQLNRVGRDLERAQLRWRAEVRLGQRVQEVVACARESGADLIILTGPRPDPANPLAGWASLSVRVSLVAPCPILLVR